MGAYHLLQEPRAQPLCVPLQAVQQHNFRNTQGEASMSILTLQELREDFWHVAFKNGKRCGVMRDGHYDSLVDRDWLVMFCGGGV